MQFDDIRDQILAILSSVRGRFLTSYQICQMLEESNPALWRDLVRAYPSAHPATPMGEGTGHRYSPASFVSNALKHFLANGSVPGLRQESLDSRGSSFNGIEPGFTGPELGIWAIGASPSAPD